MMYAGGSSREPEQSQTLSQSAVSLGVSMDDNRKDNSTRLDKVLGARRLHLSGPLSNGLRAELESALFRTPTPPLSIAPEPGVGVHLQRRYNRVSEYWKTLYPNVVDVVGHAARETAYRLRFHI
ncbi:hypothetical protein HaLaN_23954 [Haematococcus lacustris]|uniref:Uncharacterized protein n=1 Tax=Haematococcus lacustris TaxID=44745 RepID=A0A699ZXP6_HAELA|nr:hypothetical protein HaLaN_23954 [Haematococcus lacustris]